MDDTDYHSQHHDGNGNHDRYQGNKCANHHVISEHIAHQTNGQGEGAGKVADELDTDIFTPEQPEYVAAIGAAVLAGEEIRKL